jgi:peptidyl-tRNA hydrolase
MTDERQEVSPEQYEVIKAVLGADAETFKRTQVGRYIFDRIDREEEQLIEELIEAAARSVETELQRLSNDIYKRRTLRNFIDEAIQTGHAAKRNLDQIESIQQSY